MLISARVWEQTLSWLVAHRGMMDGAEERSHPSMAAGAKCSPGGVIEPRHHQAWTITSAGTSDISPGLVW